MRISDWSSDVCSSDLYGCFNYSNFRAEPPSGRSSDGISGRIHPTLFHVEHDVFVAAQGSFGWQLGPGDEHLRLPRRQPRQPAMLVRPVQLGGQVIKQRSEEPTS